MALDTGVRGQPPPENADGPAWEGRAVDPQRRHQGIGDSVEDTTVETGTGTNPVAVDRFKWERKLRADATVTGSRMLVLMTLGTFMNADGSSARPGQETLAKATGLTDRAVRRHLAAARADGWLLQTRRGGRRGDGVCVATEYQASLPDSGVLLTDVSTGHSTGHPEPVEESQPDAQPDTGSISTGHPCPPTKSVDHENHESACAVLQGLSDHDIARRLLSTKNEDLVGELAGHFPGLRRKHGDRLHQALTERLEHGFKFRFPNKLLEDIAHDLYTVEEFDKRTDFGPCAQCHQEPGHYLMDGKWYCEPCRETVLFSTPDAIEAA